MNQNEIDAAFREGQKRMEKEMPKFLAAARIAENGYAAGVRRFPDIPGVRWGLNGAVRREWFGQFTAPSQRDTDDVEAYLDTLIA